ncbi:hypothetical protein OIU84_006396 [Salix udensis]|uniref:Uncharacterized protein n=1 Tax=Salix udensis TaxID=889485 RepID=A0AAD6P270_9ROSI|nr:hypothetical protein OIU84_006396 [Salix udensis]
MMTKFLVLQAGVVDTERFGGQLRDGSRDDHWDAFGHTLGQLLVERSWSDIDIIQRCFACQLYICFLREPIKNSDLGAAATWIAIILMEFCGWDCTLGDAFCLHKSRGMLMLKERRTLQKQFDKRNRCGIALVYI